MATRDVAERQESVQMKWLGHSCFYLVSPGGTRVVTDPFAPSVPYPKLFIECDVVTISHEHSDHNDVSGLKGSPKVMRGLDRDTKAVARLNETVGDVSFRTVASDHDADGGQKRGKNAIFVMDFAGLKIAHLGDLGHGLPQEAVQEIGPVDVLLIPVGGYYTVDGTTAASVAASLSPRIVVPMHFRTGYTASWPISGPEDFLSAQSRVKEVGNQASVSLSSLPAATETWLFKV